jgi:hypothetical protein
LIRHHDLDQAPKRQPLQILTGELVVVFIFASPLDLGTAPPPPVVNMQKELCCRLTSSSMVTSSSTFCGDVELADLGLPMGREAGGGCWEWWGRWG